MNTEKIRINNQISGILTYPENTNSTERKPILPAVLMLHGFGSNKDEVNGFYERIALELATKNIISLRIDFRGYGNSAGNTEDFSVNDMTADAIKAFHHLTTLSVKDKIGVIGFSLGAAIALMLSQQVIFHSLTLISPTLNLPEDFNSFLGKETITQLIACNDFIEADIGWRKINISKNFFESLSTCNPNKAATQFTGNLFCIAGERDFSAKNAREIYTLSPSTTKKLEIVPEADHIFNTRGLTAISEKTVSWMAFFLKKTDVIKGRQRTY